MREEDQQVLEALARAREEHQELARVLDFYRALATVQFRAKAQLSAYVKLHDEAVMRQRLEDGMPQLTFGQLTIDPATLARLVNDIADVMVHHNPDWAQMADRVEEPAADELMQLARQAFDGQPQWTQAEHSASGLIALAVELALIPYLEWTSEALMPHLDQSLWRRGYCPLCGASPDLALLDEETGARHLICRRCSSQWRYARLKCPFCETTDHTNLQYYLSDDKVYRLYVCQNCKQYIKTVDLRQARKRVFAPVERIVTVAMDMAAQEMGFAASQCPSATA